MSIQVVKLSIGQDIIADVVEDVGDDDGDGHITIRNPEYLVLDPQRNMYIMMPQPAVLPLAKRDLDGNTEAIKIAVEHIICRSIVGSETERVYKGQFNKVQTVEKPELILPR